MLKTYYPFELKNIDSVGEYLFIVKNCFRLAAKHGISRRAAGLIFFIRWENSRNQWVIDFSNKVTRKSDGYCYDDLHLFSNNITKFNLITNIYNMLEELNFVMLFEKYSLKTKLNKTIGFVYEGDIVYPLGLFRYNDIGNQLNYKEVESKNIIIELTSNNNRMHSLNLQIKLMNYVCEYKSFLSKLKETSLAIKDNDDIQLNDYLSYNKKTYSKKLSYKDYNSLVKTNCMPSNKDLFYYIIYSITIELTKYINQKTKHANKSIDLIINDKNNNKKIKLPIEFYKNDTITTIQLLAPLIPMRF